ncbi:hypothetical protein JOF41_004377 [Saccharothrix coeruleofusca]|uniref:hypothetical protein n=1 Tax=Saccharothrix coeruleofusca TaxID=33919 RepID=UPI001AE1E910|nr:hypothetical protein [Saccharothrix coeruleofusca]MBP2338199.1 hypothetical protein [Saccharothrix coeruleofusca]
MEYFLYDQPTPDVSIRKGKGVPSRWPKPALDQHTRPHAQVIILPPSASRKALPDGHPPKLFRKLQIQGVDRIDIHTPPKLFNRAPPR